MGNSKILYRGFSFMSFLWMLFLRLAALVIIILALPYYNENPIAILIVALFCAFAILFFGDNQIDVYEDRIELSTNSFASFIFKSKDKTYYIKEIKRAYLPSSKISAVDFTLVMIVKMLGPRRSVNRTDPIYLEMINAKEERIDTSLDEDKRKRIVQVINSLCNYD